MGQIDVGHEPRPVLVLVHLGARHALVLDGFDEGAFPVFRQEILVLTHEMILEGGVRDKTVHLEALLKLLGLDRDVDAPGDVVEYGVKKAVAPLELLDRECLGVRVGLDVQNL